MHDNNVILCFRVSVRLGEYDTQGNPDCIQEQDGFDCAEEAMEFEVEKVIVHPYYDEKSRNKHHDIALIKTKKPVKYSTYIQPICIPASNLSSGIIPGKRMTLAGWGATDKCKKCSSITFYPCYAHISYISQFRAG